MQEQLIALAIQEVPNIIEALKEAFHKKEPTAPVPTEAEVIAAFNQAFTSSLAKDDLWLAQNPM